jgi:hypothetical protein
MARSFTFAAVIAILLAVLTGCLGRPQLFPNSDKNLQKTSTAFAADAAKRFPYKLDAPRAGEAQARAQVGYMSDVFEIVNVSDTDWENVEVWINQQYVVFLPTMESQTLKHMTFHMIYNDKGQNLPTNKYQIEKVELLRDGKMYDVKLQLAD